ncbi:MAG TPA: hypothetical protein VIU61_15760 [Kofleriaceae bacterium]
MTDRIAQDLAALGTDSRRGLAELDDVLRTSSVYRDDRPGAQARRDALADDRRRELAMMPLTLAHVFAHRVARAAAGGAAMLCALVLVAMLLDPMIMRLATYVVPGLDIGMCVMLSGGFILAIYILATWIAEARFARRMRASITMRGDVYRDLDHLATGPLDAGYTLLRRADGWAVGLSLAGAVSLVPIIGYLLIAGEMLHPLRVAYSETFVLRSHSVTSNIALLLPPIAIGLAIALFAGIASAREHRFGARATRVLGHWSMLPIGILVGLASLYVTFRMIGRYDAFRILPTLKHSKHIAYLGEAAILIPAMWTVLWWRGREHARIGDEQA